MRIYIGIDPDVDRSGFATWSPSEKKLQLFTFSIDEIFIKILFAHHSYDLTVVIEAGWLIKRRDFRGRGKGEAYDVGRNHEIGLQIEKYCIRHCIKYRLIKPAGYSAWSHDQFCKVTGWDTASRTNSEKRVAGMLIYGL